MAKVSVYLFLSWVNNIAFIYAAMANYREGIITLLFTIWGIIKIIDAYKTMKKK